jgi:hypothetical protein
MDSHLRQVRPLHWREMLGGGNDRKQWEGRDVAGRTTNSPRSDVKVSQIGVYFLYA